MPLNLNTAATRDNPDTTVVYTPSGNPIVLDLRDGRQTPVTGTVRVICWGAVGTVVGLVLHGTTSAVLWGWLPGYWLLVVLGVLGILGTSSYLTTPSSPLRYLYLAVFGLALGITLGVTSPSVPLFLERIQ